jgi:hypothetical protein
MNATALETARSRKAIRTGLILSAIAVLFLAFDTAMKVLALPPAVEGTTKPGYPASTMLGIGIVQLVWAGLWLRDRRIRALLAPWSSFNRQV